MSSTVMAQVSGATRVNRDDVLARRARVQNMQEIKEIASDVSYLTQVALENLSDENLEALKKALKRSKKILKGKIDVEPTPVETYLSCEDETTQTMNFSKKAEINSKINSAVKDSFEFNFIQADKFSAQWMEEYACDAVDAFIANAKALNKASKNHMELNFIQAAKYAQENVDQICDAHKLEATAKQINDYADDQLGMNFIQAGKYTKDWVQNNLMGCSLPKAGDVKY